MSPGGGGDESAMAYGWADDMRRREAQAAVSTKLSAALQSMPPEDILQEIVNGIREKKIQVQSMRINTSAVNEARVIVEINLERDQKLPTGTFGGNMKQPASPNTWDEVEKKREAIALVEKERKAAEKRDAELKAAEKARRKVPEGTRDLDLD